MCPPGCVKDPERERERNDVSLVRNLWREPAQEQERALASVLAQYYWGAAAIPERHSASIGLVGTTVFDGALAFRSDT